MHSNIKSLLLYILVYDLIASVESSKSNAIVLAPMDEMTKVMGSIAEIEIEAKKAKYRAVYSAN